MSRHLCAALIVAGTLPFGSWTEAQEFTYSPAGQLVAGSGDGRADDRVYVPNMRFPIEQAPAYANSQVWGNGGMNGGGGSQCDEANYSYPWWDNYCESRSWDMPLCPSSTGHQGQDIRPGSCVDNTHWTVAAEAGEITSIGSYSVYLQTSSGTIHRYLHMSPASVIVSVGDEVEEGERLGRISNAFGDSSTTIHLHYDISMNVEGEGFVYVPTYMSLIRSYEALLGEPGSTCGDVPADGIVLDNSSPCFFLHGPAATWRYVSTTGYDGDLYWSYTWENSESNWAEWVFEFDVEGEYRIEAYITPEYAQSEDTRYSVRAGDQDTELRIDQSGGDGWLAIGTFEFAAGRSQNVAVYDGPGEASALQRQFVADALRITPIAGVVEAAEEVADSGGPGAPDVGAPDAGAGLPDGGEDAPGNSDRTARGGAEAFEVTVNDGCGCATRGEAKEGLWLFLLLGAGAIVRRRKRLL
jgi:MYXO-CTERM domain-containing protein